MVRPIDMQDNLSKAPLASRVQGLQQGAAEMAQRQAAIESRQQHALDQTRTTPTAEAQGSRVNADAERDRRQQQQRQRQREEPEAAEANTTGDPSHGRGDDGHIDIVA